MLNIKLLFVFGGGGGGDATQRCSVWSWEAKIAIENQFWLIAEYTDGNSMTNTEDFYSCLASSLSLISPFTDQNNSHWTTFLILSNVAINSLQYLIVRLIIPPQLIIYNNFHTEKSTQAYMQDYYILLTYSHRADICNVSKFGARAWEHLHQGPGIWELFR